MRLRATLSALAAATILMSGGATVSAAEPLAVTILSQVTPAAFAPASGQVWKPQVRTAEPVTWTLTVRDPKSAALLHTQTSATATTTVSPTWNGKDITGRILNQAVAYTLTLSPATGDPATVTGTLTVIGTATTTTATTLPSFTPDRDGRTDTWTPVFTANRPVTWTVSITKTTGPGVGDGSNAWGGHANGKIPANALCALSFAPAHQLRCDAAKGFERVNTAYRAAFGTNISVTDTYRPYTDQLAVYAKYGYPRAAIPGTSDHGWALAADLGGGINQFGTAQYNWMKAHAPQYGWVHPARAEPGGKYPEAWHWVWDNGRGALVAQYTSENATTRFAPTWNGLTGSTLNADGTYTWTATATDGASAALIRSGAVVLRARALATTVRAAAYSSDARNDGRIPVSWSTPSMPGVTGWNVSYRRVGTSSTGARTYGTTYRWLTGTRATSATFNGTPGKSYEFLVTPVDTIRPKNPAGSALSHHTLDDRALTFSAGWANQYPTGRYKSTLKSSAIKGRTATLVFYGTGVKVIGEKSTVKGQFYVSIDGARPVLVDSYASATRPKQTLYATALKGGRHTLKITVVGTAKRPTVSLDGVGVTH